MLCIHRLCKALYSSSMLRFHCLSKAPAFFQCLFFSSALNLILQTFRITLVFLLSFYCRPLDYASMPLGPLTSQLTPDSSHLITSHLTPLRIDIRR
jgi:hypothetical protein